MPAPAPCTCAAQSWLCWAALSKAHTCVLCPEPVLVQRSRPVATCCMESCFVGWEEREVRQGRITYWWLCLSLPFYFSHPTFFQSSLTKISVFSTRLWISSKSVAFSVCVVSDWLGLAIDTSCDSACLPASSLIGWNCNFCCVESCLIGFYRRRRSTTTIITGM